MDSTTAFVKKSFDFMSFREKNHNLPRVQNFLKGFSPEQQWFFNAPGAPWSVALKIYFLPGISQDPPFYPFNPFRSFLDFWRFFEFWVIYVKFSWNLRFPEPQSVSSSKKIYREETDSVRAFVSTLLIKSNDDNDRVKYGEVYETYRSFCYPQFDSPPLSPI